MKFGLAFTYQFKDPDWLKKFLITCAIGLIPVIGTFYISGWMLTIARRVASGEELPSLPEVDFSAYLKQGVLAAIINLIYSLPILVVAIPLGSMAGSMQTNEDLSVVFMLASFCFGLIIFGYSLILSIVSPAALTNMVVKDSFGAAFRFKEIFGLIKAAPGAYLLTLVGVLITGFVAPLGLIACGIGVLATSVYTFSLTGHLFGQAYRTAKVNQGFSSQPL